MSEATEGKKESLVNKLKMSSQDEDQDDQDTKHAKDLVKKTAKKGAQSAGGVRTTTPPPQSKEPVVHLGGYVKQSVHDALMDDVAASRGKWNKTKLVEYILAKHYGLDV